MGYDKNTGKITAPVGIADLQKCLGTGKSDLGTIISTSYINIWAKNKPVVYGKTFVDDAVSNGLFAETGSDKFWWKGNQLNCGITIPFGGNPMEASEQAWSYTRPAGGANAPFRLSDFIGYDRTLKEYKNNKAPITFNAPSTADDRHPFICYFKVKVKTTSLLGLKELFAPLKPNIWTDSNYALGMFIKHETGTDYVFVTTDSLSTIANEPELTELEIRIDHPINYPSIFKTGNLEVYPVLCNAKHIVPITQSSEEKLPYDNWSLRCLPEFPQKYISAISPYVRPKHYEVYVRSEVEPSDRGGSKMKVYLKLSIENEFQQGGTLSYKIMFSRGKNITSPILPYYEYGSIAITMLSPVGTQVEELAATVYFEHTPETTDARVEITVEDRDREDEPNSVVSREIVEWEWR